MSAKEKQSKLVRILLVMMAAFVLVCVLAAAAAYKWYQSPQTQKSVSAAKDVFRVTMEAAQAPGAASLREAGCHQAAIFDPEQANDYFKALGDLTQTGKGDELRAPLVMCTLAPKREGTLSCARAAELYGAGVEKPPPEVVVVVQVADFPQRTACAGVYSADGDLIEALPIKEL